jgi:sterol 3beta-glucosyltransferase
MILIVCNDTLGGVLPYARLGAALQAAGHAVTAAAPEEMTALFTDRNIPVHPLPGTAEAAALAAGGLAEQGTLATLRVMRDRLPAVIAGWLTATMAAADGARLILGGIGGSGLGRAVGQARGIAFQPVHLHPLGAPSWDYPAPMLGTLPGWAGPLARRLSHPVGAALLDLPTSGALTGARKAVLGQTGRLPPEGPAIYALSRHLVPVPPAPGRLITGIWRDDAEPDLPAPVAAFLDRARGDGVPVISVGFGSMGTGDRQGLTALVTAAVTRAGARAILIGGHAGLHADGNPDLLTVGHMPHGRLFPAVDAIIHHGGAGTTGAASLSGRPQVIVPFAVDQPFWAGRVAAVRAGPPAVRRKALTVDRLANALQAALTDPHLIAGAAALGQAARAEPGLPAAVTAITQHPALG